MLPRSRHNDENIRVLTEAEAPRGWVFLVAVPGDAKNESGPEQQVELTLSWQDYEYWSHGQKSPSHIAEVVLRAVLEAQPERSLPERFDASTSRRWVRDLDERVRELL